MEEKYRDYLLTIRDANSFNRNLVRDRTSRLPFIDAHTGVAQTDCLLWHSANERMVNRAKGSQLYSYPAVRWQKRRREYLLNEPALPSHQPPNHLLNGDDPAATHKSLISVSNNNGNFNESIGFGLGKSSVALVNSSYNSSSLNLARADSTGSHSCNTVDSDLSSRDLSIVTSSCQSSSFDSNNSPRRDCLTIEEGDMATNNHHQFNNIINNQVSDRMTNLDMDSETTHLRLLEDQTKAAIKSYKSKNKKNIGSSLIKKQQTSILVKNNGRATNVDKKKSSIIAISNGNEDSLRQNNNVIGQESPNNSNGTSSGHNSKNRAPGPESNQAIIVNGSSRPYVCSICGQSYKTRPGLSYHFVHCHNLVLPRNLPHDRNLLINQELSAKQQPNKKSKRTIKIELNDNIKQEVDLSERNNDQVSFEFQESLTNNETMLVSPASTIIEENSPVIVNGHKTEEGENVIDSKSMKISKPNTFCDFCLGNVEKNRRTRLPEELISCTSCGSSGHPSCLRFSDNIMNSVKKYNWQCIECKTCSNCNNADREDQLLFCDDCDRSYHTYCLNPPLEEPPEGGWNCQLCQSEYHHKKDK